MPEWPNVWLKKQKRLVTIDLLVDFGLLRPVNVLKRELLVKTWKNANSPAETQCYGLLQITMISKCWLYIADLFSHVLQSDLNWQVQWSFVFLQSKNANHFFVAKRGVVVPCIECRNWGQECNIACLWQNAVFCEEGSGKYGALYIHVTYKDVYLFPKQLVLKLYSWKPAM